MLKSEPTTASERIGIIERIVERLGDIAATCEGMGGFDDEDLVASYYRGKTNAQSAFPYTLSRPLEVTDAAAVWVMEHLGGAFDIASPELKAELAAAFMAGAASKKED